jgi:hypothetical protein
MDSPHRQGTRAAEQIAEGKEQSPKMIPVFAFLIFALVVVFVVSSCFKFGFRAVVFY